VPLLRFLQKIDVDLDDLRETIRQQPPKTFKIAKDLYRKPKAESDVDAAVAKAGSDLLPWFWWESASRRFVRDRYSSATCA